jgi:hypothetical protein
MTYMQCNSPLISWTCIVSLRIFYSSNSGKYAVELHTYQGKNRPIAEVPRLSGVPHTERKPCWSSVRDRQVVCMRYIFILNEI